MSREGIRIEPLGEVALLLRLEPGAMPERANARIHALAARLGRAAPPAVHDIVPAWASLAVLFDAGDDPAATRAEVEAWLRTAWDEATATPSAPVREHRIAVAFGGDWGPDLADLARHAGCTRDALVERFCAAEYRVAMLGFAPGFPYLLGLDPALAMPRLATPRPEVAAGSVAIAGDQAGIYPRRGPGGWRVLGRTAAPLFDAGRTPPALLAAGDRVRFVAT